MSIDTVTHYPPYEMHSLFVPVTTGCSYNRCAYCSMYQDIAFSEVPLREIRQQLMNAQSYHPYPDRIFLTGAEPLCIGYQKMKTLLQLIREYFPYCTCIASYASVKNLRSLNVKELEHLHSLGLGPLYIGLESGCDRILSLMQKGHTATDAVCQMQKLNAARLPFNTILMYGLGGAGTARENALASASMVNQFRTEQIIMMNLTVFANTTLESWCREGVFQEASNSERAEELRILLEELHPVTPTRFTTEHVTNFIDITGVLPKDKEAMLASIHRYCAS
ncbi:MAG TPA: radical SAM protein [Lachnospiraceae bacterium]|nr:radical SAM protein [Lachnospiraceae bacterium]